MINKDFISIRQVGHYARVPVGEIQQIVAGRRNISIITIDTVYQTYCSLDRFMQCLPEKLFCRVHRSHVVSLNAVTKFEYERIFIGESKIPLSDFYRQNFFSRMNIVNPVYRKKKNDVPYTG